MMGTRTPALSRASRIAGTAAAAASVFTVTRTSSEPAAPVPTPGPRCGNVRRVRVGHGLDDDRMTAADLDTAGVGDHCATA